MKKPERFTVNEPEELMKFLVARLPHKNRNNIKTLLKKREVLVDGKAVTQYNHLLQPGQQVELSTSPVPRARRMRG
ncbi:MAG: S4 domain-containing protein, partial [Mangrovibacterium sp.]|nr:S4 domain-containing protein [Mangrovibacterium sp.]